MRGRRSECSASKPRRILDKVTNGLLERAGSTSTHDLVSPISRT